MANWLITTGTTTTMTLMMTLVTLMMTLVTLVMNIRRVSALSYQANYNSQHPSPDDVR